MLKFLFFSFFPSPKNTKKNYSLNTISRKSFKQSERKSKSDKAKTALIQESERFFVGWECVRCKTVVYIT